MQPMIGVIMERSAGKPQPLAIAKKGPVVPAVLTVPPAAKRVTDWSTVKNTSGSKLSNGIFNEDTDSKDENSLILESMSPEELQAALEEVNSLLSAKNIAFLKGKRNIGLDNAMVVDSELDKRRMLPVPSAHAMEDVSVAEKRLESVDAEQSSDNAPRFNLEGRRVISKTSLAAEITAYLSTLLVCDSDCSEIASLANEVVDGVVSARICFNFLSRDDPSTSDLFNHEFSPDSPGYDLREICELFRSEYPLQRSIAVKILQGLLQIRDCIVSLVPYCGRTGSTLSDESTSSTLFHGLCLYMKNPLNQLSQMKFKNGSSSGSGGSHCSGGNVGRNGAATLLVDLLLRYCGAEKLPPSLPSLLLWSLQLRNTPALQLSCLLTSQYYLTSSVENTAASSVVDWKGLWGAFGTPPLLTPHSKRQVQSLGTVVTTYEKHHMECLEKAQPSRNNDERGNEVQEEDDVHTSFILKCRWNRVEAFFGELSFASKVVSLSVLHTEQLLIRLRKWEKGEAAAAVSALESVEFSTGQVCLDLLILAPSALTGSSDTMMSLCHQVLTKLQPLYREVESLTLTLWKDKKLIFSASSSSMGGVIGDYLVSWWKLLCGFTRWSQFFSQFLFSPKQSQASVFDHVAQWCSDSNPPPHLLWCLRLARLSLIQDAAGLSSEQLIAILSSDRLSLLPPSALTIEATAFGSVECECLSWLELCSVTVSQWLVSLNLQTTAGKKSDISVPLLQTVCDLLLAHCERVALWLAVEKSIGSEIDELRASAMHFLLSIVGSSNQYCTNVTDASSSTASLFAIAILQLEVRGMALIPAVKALNRESEVLSVDWQSRLTKCQRIFNQYFDENRHFTWLSHKTGTDEEVTKALLHKAELNLACQRLSLSPLMKDTVAPYPTLLPHVSSLSSGLLSWQLGRLYQTSLLLELQRTAMNSGKSDGLLFTQFLSCVCSFTDGVMSGIACYLLNAYLHCVLISTNSKSVLFSQQVDDVRASLLTAITGVSLPSPQFSPTARLRLGSYGALLGQIVPISHSFVCHWLLNCYTGQFPLPAHWQYSCLPQLTGAALAHWFNHLLLSVPQQQSQKTRESWGVAMYHLLKLATEENAVKWIETNTDISGMSDVSVSDDAARSYSSLLAAILKHVSNSAEDQLFVSDLTVVAKQNHFSVPSLSGRAVKASAASSLSGLLELTNKLCESALSLAVHSEVHCASLCVLLHPAMPVLIRTKIWRQLTELKLLHLLECDSIWSEAEFMSLFHCSESQSSNNSRSEMACFRVMLAGLCTLRGDLDKQWRIVTVMLHQIACHVFSHVLLTPSDSSTTLLIEMLRNDFTHEGQRIEVPDWVLLEVLGATALGGTTPVVALYHNQRLAVLDIHATVKNALNIYTDESTRYLHTIVSKHRADLV